MKTISLHFLCLLLFLPFLQAQPTKSASKKLALVVGIGNYPGESQWNKLAAENDIKIIKGTLLHQGFSLSDIQVVKDKAATRKGILQAFKMLHKKAGVGDQLYFHFSGHGQQIKDNNGDELDGFDEAIVPYDSPKHFEKNGYQGKNLIRDEEIGEQLNQLRAKVGPGGHVLTVIDACHSGTGTRGYGKIRGTSVIMADSAYISQHRNQAVDNNSLTGEAPTSKQDLAPVVAFFSAAARQKSYEYVSSKGENYGILSYAFSKAMQLSSQDVTYQALFDKIRAEILSYSSQQTPQAEGELDLIVLNGQFVPKPSYFKVSEHLDDLQITLDAGKMQGLFEETKVGVFPIGTRSLSQATPKAIGYVNYATLFDCNIDLETKLSKQEALNSWIFVLEPNFGPLSVQVQIDLPDDIFKEKLTNSVNQVPAIQLTVSQPDLLIIQDQTKGDQEVIKVFSNRDQLIMQEYITAKNTDLLTKKILNQMIRFAQAEYLRYIRFNDLNQPLKLDFYYKNQWINGMEQPIFQLGEPVKVRIKNQGELPVYFSVIDIQPDNNLNLVIPWDRTADEYYLPPGETYIFEETLYPSSPTGIEVLKLIGSRNPINWSHLLANWNAGIRRSKKEAGLGLGPGSVQTILFRIVN